MDNPAITVQGNPRDTLTAVRPVFLKVSDLPESTKEFTVCEICKTCEVVNGPQSMEGAQRIGGLWRLYPKTSDTRIKLLLSGIDLRGVHLSLQDINPFILGPDRAEVQSTRLLVNDVPLSFNNKDIETTLSKLGCKMLSPIKYELQRDEHHQLTLWKTGRRYVYIAVPASPLQRDVKIGLYKAKLYHREQKQGNLLVCFNCFQRGHISRECPDPTLCRACKQEGHKQGDSVCLLNVDSQARSISQPHPAPRLPRPLPALPPPRAPHLSPPPLRLQLRPPPQLRPPLRMPLSSPHPLVTAGPQPLSTACFPQSQLPRKLPQSLSTGRRVTWISSPLWICSMPKEHYPRKKKKSSERKGRLTQMMRFPRPN